MLQAIIGYAIRNKLVIGLLTLALIGYGAYQATLLPIDAVPDITNNQVQVITVAPSFGATDIERLVTFPIEQANSNIPGIKEMRSFSRFGLSLVTIVFDDATDVYWARQQVAERLQSVQNSIPPGIGQPQLGPVTTGLGEIYQYVVRPKKGYEHRYTAMELRTIQDWVIRRQLVGVKGVAEVSSFGGYLKQYSIEVNPAQLLSHRITINDIFDALQQNNQNTGGAYIEKQATVLYIRTEGLTANIEDIGNIPIRQNSGGTPLLLRDVATINIGSATRYGALCYNDQGEVAGGVVMMLKGANSSDVIKRVKERIAQVKKALPEGVMIEPFLDRTKMINNAIGTVETNLLEGALIVVFVLVLFLGNLRAGLLVASVIPLAMLFAVIMMNLFGVTGNLMSLGALDFGLIVDGAVIIVEAVMHQVSHNKKYPANFLMPKTEMDQVVGSSAGKMMNSAVFGQIIILVVYLPIFTLQGIEGKMFKPMAQTVAFALLGAFVLSVTYVPMMSALFLSRRTNKGANWSDKLMAKVEQGYQRLLASVIRFPKTVIASVALLFAAAVIVLQFLGGEFIPALEEGDFAVDTRVLTGSNLQTTIGSTQKAAHILMARFPEVEKVVTKIGSGEVPTDPMPMEASDMMVILKDKRQWTSAKTFDELAEKMGKAISDVPGITTGFQFPVQMRFNELMTGARQDVVCKIFGEDLDSLTEYANRLGGLVTGIKGVTDLYVEPVAGLPQLVITYNRAALSEYNLPVNQVNRIVNTALAGQVAGQLFEGEKRFDMVVRIGNNSKKEIDDIKQLLIPTPAGTQVPLYLLAEVALKESPNQIQREDAKRRITVGFNVRGRDVKSIVQELQQKADQQLKLPAGYYVTYGGTFENLQAATNRLMIAVPVALLLILVLLYFAFNNLKHAFLIYTAIPLSAIGGILLLAIRGMPFSISAGVGFIALFGVAVLNGIVLVAEFNRIKLSGETDLRKVVLAGTRLRLRPVLMTALVASLGFLPMALSNGAGAEVQRPLATVVIGGLLIATFLTLFVLPILYMLFETSFKKRKPMQPIAAAVLLLLINLTVYKSQAQVTITLPAAIDSALHNNLQQKNAQLMSAYQQSLIKTYHPINPTSVGLEAGQINSIYTDTRFTVSQHTALPGYFKAQRKQLEASWKESEIQVKMDAVQLRRQVANSYAQLQFLLRQQRLLQETDSLYQEFNNRAQLRLKAGAANLLEATTAANLLLQVQLMQQQVKEDIAMATLQLQLQMNTVNPYWPLLKAESIQKVDTSFNGWQLHPSILLLQQQQATAQADRQLEKARLLPTVSIGYGNGSIQGTGADNKLYGAGKRFHTAMLGIEIPIFTKAQKAKINSAQIKEQLAGNAVTYQTQQIAAAYQTALLEVQKYQTSLQLYQQQLLPNAAVIKTTASKQLQQGAINYLEWVQLVQPTVETGMAYNLLQHQLAQAQIQLSYYTQP